MDLPGEVTAKGAAPVDFAETSAAFEQGSSGTAKTFIDTQKSQV